MSHRGLLVGKDLESLRVLDAELRALGVSTAVAAGAHKAGLLARQFTPSVLIVVGTLSNPEDQEIIAALSVHPATVALPTFSVCSQDESTDAVRAMKSGIINVIKAPTTGAAVLNMINAALGADDDDPRRLQVNDRRGPTLLRRIGDYLKLRSATGKLSIFAPTGKAMIEFTDGAIIDAEVGTRKGADAIRALLAATTKEPWDFAFRGQNKHSPQIDSGTLDLDIEFIEVEPFSEVEQAPVNSRPQPSQIPLQVLIADDDTDLLNLYSRFMEREGWEVTTATDGVQAYELALKERPDAIVSDIMMPESDGWAFLTSVRDDYRLRETPFLLLSCHGDFLSNLEHLDAGADDYLQKGLRGDEVVTRIRSAAEKSRELAEGFDTDIISKGQLAEIGVQKLLLTLSRKRATGQLSVKEGWSEHRVWFNNGKITRATTANGALEASGRDALERTMATDVGSFIFQPGTPLGTGDFYFPDIKDDLAIRLNRQRENERENLLADDTPLVFNDALLAFYKTVSTDSVRPIIDLLTQGKPPRRVMFECDASPILVEWVVKDLLRKRIAAFRDPNLT